MKDVWSPTAPNDADRLHKLVNRIAVTGATFATLAFVLAFALTLDPTYLRHAAGPAVAGVFFLTQRLLRREDTFTAMMFGALVVVVAFMALGEPSTAIGSALGLVCIGMVGGTFLHRRLGLYLVSGSLVVGVTPWLWSSKLPVGISPLTTAVVMVIGFVAGASVMAMLRKGNVDATARLRALFDSAPIGLIEQDWSEAIAHLTRSLPDGEDAAEYLLAHPRLLRSVVGRASTVRSNRMAIEILGAERNGLLGSIPPQFTGDETLERWAQQVAAILRGAGAAFHEVEVVRLDGSITHLDVEVIVVDGDVGSVVTAMKDVSHVRDARRSLEDLVRAKDQFIATVSHELRTPLSAVVGFTEAMRSGEITDPEELGEFLQLISLQSREVSHIVEDLLVGARADIGTIDIRPMPIELTVLTSEVVADQDVDVEMSSDTFPATAVADPLRVRQIIRNLVSNSSRYGSGRRRAVAGIDGSLAYLEIRDEGPPLPMEDRTRIFEAYERAHERPGVPGSVGLGLSVSHQLARLMGGDLSYDHDGETVFRLTLPATGSTDPRLDPSAAGGSRATASSTSPTAV